MNTHDLRTLLTEHADTVTDLEPAVRLGSVHHRIGVARRRRTAGAVVAAVLALLVAGIGVSTLGGPKPPPPTEAPERLAGIEVPPTITADGFTYRFAKGYEGDPGQDVLRTNLETGVNPALVAYASTDFGGTPRLSVDGDVSAERSDDFSAFALVGPEQQANLELSQGDLPQDDRLALATYELVPGDAGAAVDDGTVGFPGDHSGLEFVAGVLGEPGEASVQLPLDLPVGRVVVYPTCYGSTDGAELAVDGDRSGFLTTTGAGCGEARIPFDARQDRATVEIRDAGAERLTVRLTDARERLVQDEDVVVGLAVYRDTRPTVPLLGEEIPVVETLGGRSYELNDQRVADAGERVLRWSVPASTVPLRIAYVVRVSDDQAAGFTFLVDGENEDGLQTGDGFAGEAFVGPGVVVPAGKAVDVVLRSTGDGAPPELALLVARQVE